MYYYHYLLLAGVIPHTKKGALALKMADAGRRDGAALVTPPSHADVRRARSELELIDIKLANAESPHENVESPPEPVAVKPFTWEDPGGLQLDRRSISIIIGTLLIIGVVAGVFAFLCTTGELSGRRPGSRLPPGP